LILPAEVLGRLDEVLVRVAVAVLDGHRELDLVKPVFAAVSRQRLVDEPPQLQLPGFLWGRRRRRPIGHCRYEDCFARRAGVGLELGAAMEDQDVARLALLGKRGGPILAHLAHAESKLAWLEFVDALDDADDPGVRLDRNLRAVDAGYRGDGDVDLLGVL